MTTEFNPHGFNHSFPRVYEAEEGKYVEYSDYARLKAEVERLTKAGDAMISEWSSGDEKDAKNFLKALAIWHAAKGVQS
jgi:hypothetical protein